MEILFVSKFTLSLIDKFYWTFFIISTRLLYFSCVPLSEKKKKYAKFALASGRPKVFHVNDELFTQVKRGFVRLTHYGFSRRLTNRRSTTVKQRASAGCPNATFIPLFHLRLSIHLKYRLCCLFSATVESFTITSLPSSYTIGNR